MATGRLVRWQNSQGGQAGGPAGRAVLEVRTGHQRRDRQDAGPQRAAVSARYRRRGDRVKRREFISLLGGAVAWPLAARAQQPDRMRRVGVLLPATAGDSEYPGLVQAFLTELKQLGWTNNVNIAIDIRWVGGAAEDLRKSAGE